MKITYEDYYRSLTKKPKLTVISKDDLVSYIKQLNNKFDFTIYLTYDSLYNTYLFKFNNIEYYLDGFLLYDFDWIHIKGIIKYLLVDIDYKESDLFYIDNINKWTFMTYQGVQLTDPTRTAILVQH